MSSTGLAYLADTANHRVRVITPAGAVSTFLGGAAIGAADGVGTAAALTSPLAVALDEAGARLFFTSAHTLRVAALAGGAAGTTATLAGVLAAGFSDGEGIAAALANPRALLWAPAANALYVLDDARVPRALTGAAVASAAGSGAALGGDGLGAAGGLSAPAWGLALDDVGRLLVGDSAANVVRRVTLGAPLAAAPSAYNTIAGAGGAAAYADGPAAAAAFSNPRGLARAPGGALLVVEGGGNRVRAVVCASTLGALSASASPSPGAAASATPSASLTPTATASVTATATPPYSGCLVSTLSGNGSAFSADGSNATAAFTNPYGIILDAAAAFVLVADFATVRAVSVANGSATTLAGNGIVGWQDAFNPLAAQFNFVQSLALAKSGVLYIADAYNHRLRALLPSGGVVTLVGSVAGYFDGPGAASLLNYPEGLALNTDESRLFIAVRLARGRPPNPPDPSPPPPPPPFSLRTRITTAFASTQSRRRWSQRWRAARRQGSSTRRARLRASSTRATWSFRLKTKQCSSPTAPIIGYAPCHPRAG